MDIFWLLVIIAVLSVAGALLLRQFLPCMVIRAMPIHQNDSPPKPVDSETADLESKYDDDDDDESPTAAKEPADGSVRQVRFREPISDSIPPENVPSRPPSPTPVVIDVVTPVSQDITKSN